MRREGWSLGAEPLAPHRRMHGSCVRQKRFPCDLHHRLLMSSPFKCTMNGEFALEICGLHLYGMPC